MDISGLNAYTDYLTSQNMTKTNLEQKIDGKDYTNASEDELLDACKQFEAYFLEQVFKEMQKTVDCLQTEDSTSPNSNLVDYFKDTTIQELATTSTDVQGLGLAQTLYEQMKRNYNL